MISHDEKKRMNGIKFSIDIYQKFISRDNIESPKRCKIVFVALDDTADM